VNKFRTEGVDYVITRLKLRLRKILMMMSILMESSSQVRKYSKLKRTNVNQLALDCVIITVLLMSKKRKRNLVFRIPNSGLQIRKK
jgi:hypothetical protein